MSKDDVDGQRHYLLNFSRRHDVDFKVMCDFLVSVVGEGHIPPDFRPKGATYVHIRYSGSFIQ